MSWKVESWKVESWVRISNPAQDFNPGKLKSEMLIRAVFRVFENFEIQSQKIIGRISIRISNLAQDFNPGKLKNEMIIRALFRAFYNFGFQSQKIIGDFDYDFKSSQGFSSLGKKELRLGKALKFTRL